MQVTGSSRIPGALPGETVVTGTSLKIHLMTVTSSNMSARCKLISDGLPSPPDPNAISLIITIDNCLVTAEMEILLISSRNMELLVLLEPPSLPGTMLGLRLYSVQRNSTVVITVNQLGTKTN